MKTPAIQTNKLTHRYGKFEAITHLDLTVPAQSIYAFLGPNGAGKSTTLSILVNALKPTSGSAHVLGCRSTHLVPYHFTRIGYVAEPQELPDWMTGNQMLDFLKPFYPNWDDAFCSKLQATLEVPLKRKVSQMSRGEQMKLRLLSSMAYRPELLILDEPFSGLDPLVREELSGGLLELVGEGDWTVIMASHDVDEIERLADHAGFIANGHMHFSESVEGLQQRFCRVSVQFASPPQLDLALSNWRELKHEGNQFGFVDPSFDEVRCRAQLEEMGKITHFEANGMSLREIFISESKHQRKYREEKV